MCLLVDTSIHKRRGFLNRSFPKPIVLDRDLIVYKMVIKIGGQWVTPWYKTTIPPKYQSLKAKLGKDWSPFGKPVINEGIHAFIEPSQSNDPYVKRIRCMIPKDTKVYYGIGGDIVSEELIILE